MVEVFIQEDAAAHHLINSIKRSIQRRRATKVVQHTPDERLTKVRLESDILRLDLRIQVEDDHLTLGRHTQHTAHLAPTSRFMSISGQCFNKSSVDFFTGFKDFLTFLHSLLLPFPDMPQIMLSFLKLFQIRTVMDW